MDINTYTKAKYIREQIDALGSKKFKIEKMRKRDGDEEFNSAMQWAHDYVCYIINRLEEDFKSL